MTNLSQSHRQNISSAVKKDLHARLRGKPTHSNSLLSIPRTLSSALRRVILLVIVVLIITGFILAGLGGGMLYGYISTAKPLDTTQLQGNNSTSKVLDDQGNTVAILAGIDNIQSESVEYSTIKGTYIDDAFVAIEDERFYDHIGIDPRRIGSAILSALLNGGSPTHGGSTITQQTVKLMTGADDVSAQRKIQEWYQAVLLEGDLKSKDLIMQNYLNLVPMGNSYVGVQAAAKAYFDKNAADLNLPECAFLAGIPNRPSTYNPLTETGKRNALRRMRIILQKMYELGKISETEYQDALNVELVFRQTPQALTTTGIRSYFVDYAIGQVSSDLQAKLGYSKNLANLTISNGGLQIETTLSSTVQTSIEATFKTESLFGHNWEKIAEGPEKPTGSIVVMSNEPGKAGQIKGMVGGYGDKVKNMGFNRAVSAQRQPGSSIKPLAVYGPAMDVGVITAATIIPDIILHLNPDKPADIYPKNSDARYENNITVRYALMKSKNTVAAQIWKYYLGGDTSLQYLKQVGIDRNSSAPGGLPENYVSISLGGFSKGMTTLEMAGGYSTLANEGVYTKPYCYTRVLDSEGNVLLENTTPEITQVYKHETTHVMISMMKGVVTGGTATQIGGSFHGIAIAGKTGTTDNNRDKWFCGFTPYYTATVWYGYDNLMGVTEIPKDDRSNAILIWKDAMTRIHENLEAADFAAPSSGILTLTVCKDSGLLATPYCPAGQVISEIFVEGASANPTVNCNINQTVPTVPTVETVPVETAAPVMP